MKIAGIQKLTLLDFPGEVACTVFTAGCTLKCPFCHNPGMTMSFLFFSEKEKRKYLASLYQAENRFCSQTSYLL